MTTSPTGPKRIQLSRQRGWRKPEGAVVVARPSRWGNPYPVEQFGRELALQLYSNTLHGIWDPGLLAHLDDESFSATYDSHNAWMKRLGWSHPLDGARSELAGRDLACWCAADDACHADQLLAVANQESR